MEPRRDFVADLRSQLMTEAAIVLTPTTARLTVTPRRSPRERRIAIAIGGFAVVSATTSMAMAAQTALPGDTLYPLKRALENASTTIQIDEDDKGSSLLDHATGRLDEVNELTRQSDEPNAEAVADTLRAFADQASSASDLLFAAYAESGQESDIEELRVFTAQSMAALNELETVVPDPARAALIEAAQVVNLIDTAAFQICPSCGEGAAEMPEFEAAAVGAGPARRPRQALEAPLTVPGPRSLPARATRRHEGRRQRQGTATEAASPQAGRPPRRPRRTTTGGVDIGGKPGGGSDTNVIEDLTDRLTGGGGEGPEDTRPASRTCSTRRSTTSSADCSGTGCPDRSRPSAEDGLPLHQQTCTTSAGSSRAPGR